MRRLSSTLALLLLLVVPAFASGQGMQLTAGVGVNHFLDEAQTGLALDAYPGLDLGPLTLEAQIGYHRGQAAPSIGGSTSSTVYVPILAGARLGLPLGVLVPWIGAHGGFAYVGRKTSTAMAAVSYVDHEWEPAANAGTGIDLEFGRIGVGAAVWYDLVLDPDDGMRGVTAALSVTIGL